MERSISGKIGPYRLLRLLGEGGMGQVYLARRTFTGGVERTCVVKTIRPHLATDSSYEQMFFREAKILCLLHHQNIVQILDFDRVDGLLYLAMEYIEGQDLQAFLHRLSQKREPLPLETTLRIIAEVLRGLDYAHRRTDEKGDRLGIIHRDLTPNNILISKEGEVKIVDFGLAKSVTATSQSQSGALKGKLHYLSPEQIESKGVDLRTDVFAAGVVLYEMLAGVQPFRAESVSGLLAKIVRGEYTPASTVADVPRELDLVLARALACDPGERYASAAQMLADIEQLQARLSADSGGTIREYYLQLFDRDEPIVIEPFPPFPHSPVTEFETKERGRRTKTLSSDRRRFSRPSLWTVIALTVTALVSFFGLTIGHRTNNTEQPPVATESPPLVVAAPTPQPTPESPPAAPSPEALSLSQPAPPVATPPPVKKTVLPPDPTPPPLKDAGFPTPIPASPGFLRVGDLMPYAEVYVDGIWMDRTPTKLLQLSPGKHQVRLLYPKENKSRALTVSIKEGEITGVTSWPGD